MATDLRPYIDLTIHDRSPEDIRALALSDAAAKLPGWVPREGNTEVVILEAMALEVAEAVWAINRLPGATVETLLRLFGIEVDPGTGATATVEFTMIDNVGHTVPAGTSLRLDLDGGAVVLATTADAVAAPGAGTATAPVAATTPSSAPNGVVAGTALALVDQVFFVNSVELDSTVVNGTDPEDSAAWIARAIQRLSRLTDSLVLPVHFTAAALEDPLVERALTIDLYDGSGGPPYADTGHVTVIVRGPNANLSAPERTALEAALESAAVANLDVHVIDPTVTAVDVEATITVKAGFDPVDVIAAVEEALVVYLAPATWDWAATVYRNELISVIDQVDGVDTVVDLVDPAVNVALSGDGPLADVGALTITAAP